MLKRSTNRLSCSLSVVDLKFERVLQKPILFFLNTIFEELVLFKKTSPNPEEYIFLRNSEKKIMDIFKTTIHVYTFLSF